MAMVKKRGPHLTVTNNTRAKGDDGVKPHRHSANGTGTWRRGVDFGPESLNPFVPI